MIVSGQLSRDSLQIEINGKVLARHLNIAQGYIASDVLTVSAPITLRRRGIEMKIIAGSLKPGPDPTLIRILARANRRARAQLAFLSPTIQQALLEGCQPPEFTDKSIIVKPVPLDWDRQAQRYGFAAPTPRP